MRLHVQQHVERRRERARGLGAQAVVRGARDARRAQQRDDAGREARVHLQRSAARGEAQDDVEHGIGRHARLGRLGARRRDPGQRRLELRSGLQRAADRLRQRESRRIGEALVDGAAFRAELDGARSGDGSGDRLLRVDGRHRDRAARQGGSEQQRHEGMSHGRIPGRERPGMPRFASGAPTRHGISAETPAVGTV